MNRRLVLATRNRGKLREVGRLLANLRVDVISLGEYPDAPEADEPFATFAENSAHKALVAARATGQWTLADDSGLRVNALGGGPGVRSARVASSDADRIAWLLEQMRDVPQERRGARFVCAIALASPAGLRGVWEERVEGEILAGPQGTEGFGYDPVFWYPQACMTFAQMGAELKNEVSHRGKALRAFHRALPRLLAGE